MLISNQNNEINKKQQAVNNINFNSKVSVLKKVKAPVDSLTISPEAKFNTEVLKWIKSKFSGKEASITAELYEACLNSDDNVSKRAFKFLEEEASSRKKSLFEFIKPKEAPKYQEFGNKFLAIMLQASKNNENNHVDSNIDFLETVLHNYESEKPKEYLDIVIKSKDDEGIINTKTPEIFKHFCSQNNTDKYYNFMKILLALPKNEQNFIFNKFSTRDVLGLFKILQFSQGKNSENLIDAISKDMSIGYGANTITTCLKNSKDINKEANLQNYQTLLYNKVPLLIQEEYSQEIRDKEGIIHNRNIDAVTKLIKFFEDKKIDDNKAQPAIQEYIKFLKDDKGIVDKDFADKFLSVIGSNNHLTDYKNIFETAQALKNNDGKISEEAFSSLNILHSFKLLTENSSVAKTNDIFNKTINVIKDEKGNLLPEFLPSVVNLSKEGLLTSIPYILQISKENKSVNLNKLNAAKDFISKYSSLYNENGYAAGKKLTSFTEKDGTFDIKTLEVLNQLIDLEPNCDIFNLLSNIKDNDGQISDIVNTFAQNLLKEHKNQKDDYYIKILNLAKDNDANFNEDNIEFITTIDSLTNKLADNYEVVKQYTKAAQNNKGIVDKNYSKNLLEILSNNKHPEDYKNIFECIKLLTNKQKNIQWKEVNFFSALKRYADRSEEAKKHETLNKVVSSMSDKDGNIIAGYNEHVAITKMLKDGLISEIPIIMSISQQNGTFDDELCSAVKALVLAEPPYNRYKTAQILEDLGKNNNFSSDIFTKLNKISNMKINGDKYKILDTLKNSDSKFSQEGFNFLNYLRKELQIKEEKDIISSLNLAKNISGDYSNENISYIKSMIKVVPKVEIAKIYISAAKQKTGLVDKDYYNNLVEFLSKTKDPEDYKNILGSIGEAKNKQGNIQWKYVNNLYNLKTISDSSKMGKKFKTFNKISESIKDKNGNIIPEFINVAEECLKEKMLYEIPTIISVSKDNDKFNKDNYKKITEILRNTATEDRFKMSEYVKEQFDKAGNLDTQKIKTIKQLQAKNISKNLLGICHYLKNPDGTISVKGLALVSDLRKTYHHQIETDLVKILKVCRDKTGYINKNNVDAIKELLSINKDIDATGLVKSMLNQNGEIDETKYKMVVKLITEHKISDPSKINKIINMSRDKKGNIDSGILKLFVTLEKKGKNPENYKDILPAYKALYKYENVTSLSQLNLRQKRNLMQGLRKYKHDMSSSKFKEILSSKIFPTDESEYCSVMGRLSHSIGISVKRLPKDIESKYYKAMKTLENPKGDFMNWDFDKNPPVLELKYSLKDFKRDIMDMTAHYSYSERTKALDYYGFEIKKTDGFVELTGFPNADKPDGRLSSIKDKRVLHLINKLSPYVIEFVSQNKVTVKGSKEMSEALTDIITAFPEFLTTIGKRQHRTHDFTLDVHCLKVLQDIFTNPEYKTLSNTDKKEMQLIGLFHDLSKAENSVDKEHPENSAFNLYYLLNKLNMKEKDKLEIYNVICNHDWLTHFDFSDYAAKDMAFNMRAGESLKMVLMLSRADLKGVKKHDTYYKMYGGKLKKAEMLIQPYLRDIQRTAIHLPQTKIPKASELNQHSGVVDKIHADGITNMVLYLKPNYDLRHAGFKTCRSTDDFNVLVHGLDSKDAASMFQALGTIDSNALLSTSYILYSKGNYRAFRNEGFVLDVPATNIHAAYWRDFGSGYKKTIQNNLYNEYLFRNNPTREYISGQLRQSLNLTEKEYIQLFRNIEDMPMEELDKEHPHTANAYRNLFNNMEVSKRSFGRNYNEVLLSSPKIQGIFCYGKSPESISIYLRRYAEKNDIPIIVFG